jgi:nicotinate-nucleotide adenylyltransferase
MDKYGNRGEPDIISGAVNKRIGLFGGTFNPIHIGHLRGAEEIQEAFRLQELVFIPAAIPPHKMTENVIEANHRLEMVKLATVSNPCFSVTDVELKRPGKSYSIDTIRYFRERVEGTLFFILGGDAFVEMGSWKDFTELFTLCNFIVMMRPKSKKNAHPNPLPESLASLFQYHQERGEWVHASGHTLHFQEITYLDISSTKIREKMEKEESVKYLVPPEVEAYAQNHRLYKKTGGGERRKGLF